jgi:hypothetical protein
METKATEILMKAKGLRACRIDSDGWQRRRLALLQSSNQ